MAAPYPTQSASKKYNWNKKQWVECLVKSSIFPTFAINRSSKINRILIFRSHEHQTSCCGIPEELCALLFLLHDNGFLCNSTRRLAFMASKKINIQFISLLQFTAKFWKIELLTECSTYLCSLWNVASSGGSIYCRGSFENNGISALPSTAYCQHINAA